MKDLITKGRTRKPINMILHGVHKIGKSTFGSKAPAPIFITGEEIEEVDAAKFPKCKTFDEFLSYLTYLRDEKHEYKTLVIDTLDSIESLCWSKILEDDGAEDMARALGGYGKAYTLAAGMMSKMRDAYLVPLRDKKGMNLILLCHTSRTKVENILTQTSHDTLGMKLHRNAKGAGCYTVFSEWVSIIAFANFEIYNITDKKTGKDYAVGEGIRRMFTSPSPAYDAGNRFELKSELALEWSEIEKGVDEFYASNENPELQSLKIEIDQLITKIEDKSTREQTRQNILGVGNDLERLEKAKQYILKINS